MRPIDEADVKRAIRKVKRNWMLCFTKETETALKVVEGALSGIKTIDPVKHAKWIPHKPGDVHACSSCGFGVLVSMWFKNGMGIGPRMSHNKFRYCPYCGAMMSNAKMDGVPHDDSGQ